MSNLGTPLAILGMIALAGWQMALGHGEQLASEVVAGLLGWMVHRANDAFPPTQPPETPK